MAEMREVLARDGVATAIEVTEETADQIALMSGGVVLGEDGKTTGVRIPTLWGNQDADLGDFVLRTKDTGRYKVLSKEQYHSEFFVKAPEGLVEAIRNAPPVPEEKPEFESEEDLQAHTHRNLFEERRNNMYGRSAD